MYSVPQLNGGVALEDGNYVNKNNKCLTHTIMYQIKSPY